MVERSEKVKKQFRLAFLLFYFPFLGLLIFYLVPGMLYSSYYEENMIAFGICITYAIFTPIVFYIIYKNIRWKDEIEPNGSIYKMKVGWNSLFTYEGHTPFNYVLLWIISFGVIFSLTWLPWQLVIIYMKDSFFDRIMPCIEIIGLTIAIFAILKISYLFDKK